MRTFNAAINEARDLLAVDDDSHRCSWSRHVEKHERPRCCWLHPDTKAPCTTPADVGIYPPQPYNHVYACSAHVPDLRDDVDTVIAVAHREAWVEVSLVSVHANAARDLQIATWRRRFLDAGWTVDEDGSVWVEVDPDVPYVEDLKRPAVNPLAKLLIEIDDAMNFDPEFCPLGADLRARLRDTAKEYR